MKGICNIVLCGLVAAVSWKVDAAETEAPGSTVAVVYNSRMSESKSLAEYYAEKRNVPKSHLIGLRLPESETISRSDFTKRLQEPLLKQLERKNLLEIEIPEYPPVVTDETPPPLQVKGSIRYLALCYGVPLKIEKDPSIDELKEKFQLPEKLRENYASVDSELAALPLRSVNAQLSGPLSNRLFNTTNHVTLQPINGVLMVSRLDGPSVAIARGLIDKAIRAETNGLWGRAYFDARGLKEDSSYAKGDQWMYAAARVAQAHGFDVVLDNNPATFSASYPMSHIALYAGWYDADVSGPFALPDVEFMLGAIGYHLHSFSAATIRDPHRHWVGPLLQQGVTATMGSVYEPYLEFTPNIAILFNDLLSGFTFGEAAYACQNVLSWQNIAVGDPLYRPFGKPLSELYEHLTAEQSPLVEWAHVRFINLLLQRGADPHQLDDYFSNHEGNQKLLESSAVLQEKIASVKARLKEFDAAIQHYEKAVRLPSSPQQKKRLLLALAEGYAVTDQPEAALKIYKQFLREYPEYPEPLAIYNYMLPLAQKLGSQPEIQSITNRIHQLQQSGEKDSD